jgi:hypothetical protein
MSRERVIEFIAEIYAICDRFEERDGGPSLERRPAPPYLTESVFLADGVSGHQARSQLEAKMRRQELCDQIIRIGSGYEDLIADSMHHAPFFRMRANLAAILAHIGSREAVIALKRQSEIDNSENVLRNVLKGLAAAGSDEAWSAIGAVRDRLPGTIVAAMCEEHLGARDPALARSMWIKHDRGMPDEYAGGGSGNDEPENFHVDPDSPFGRAFDRAASLSQQGEHARAFEEFLNLSREWKSHPAPYMNAFICQYSIEAEDIRKHGEVRWCDAYDDRRNRLAVAMRSNCARQIIQKVAMESGSRGFIEYVNAIYAMPHDLFRSICAKVGSPYRDVSAPAAARSEPVRPSAAKPHNDSCFVATATYGSTSAHRVVQFRHFRDEVLQASSIGRVLVRLYYAVSPGIAALIGRSPVLRELTRTLLLEPIATFLDARGLLSGQQRDG